MNRGTERHNVNVFNLNGAFLNTLEPYAGFLQQTRSTPIAATAFHPHRMMLACSALNSSHVNLFTCQGDAFSRSLIGSYNLALA